LLNRHTQPTTTIFLETTSKAEDHVPACATTIHPHLTSIMRATTLLTKPDGKDVRATFRIYPNFYYWIKDLVDTQEKLNETREREEKQQQKGAKTKPKK